MKIRITHPMADQLRAWKVGQTYEVSDEYGAELVRLGLADSVDREEYERFAEQARELGVARVVAGPDMTVETVEMLRAAGVTVIEAGQGLQEVAQIAGELGITGVQVSRSVNRETRKVLTGAGVKVQKTSRKQGKAGGDEL